MGGGEEKEMNGVLKVILSLSFSGSIVIVLLLPFLHMFHNRFSRKWQYYICLVAVFRLLVPLAPQKNLVNTLFQAVEEVTGNLGGAVNSEMAEGQQEREGSAGGAAMADGWQAGEGDAEGKKTTDGKLPGDGRLADGQQQAESGEVMDRQQPAEEKMIDMGRQPADGQRQPLDGQLQTGTGKNAGGEGRHTALSFLLPHAWLAWLVPALFLFMRKLIIYHNFVKYIRETSEEVQDIILLEAFGRLAGQSRVRRCVALSVNSVASSPMLIGFLNPCIILPATEISPSDFEYTILHELVHCRRRDMLYKWLVQFTVCIHWFNPFAYMLQGYINKACEFSCDEEVIQKLDAKGRYAYGDTLLRAAGKGMRDKNAAVFMAFGKNKEILKERLDAIMNYRKGTKVTFVLAAVLAVMISLGASYIGVYAAGGQGMVLDAGLYLEGNTVSGNKIIQNTKTASAVKIGLKASPQAKHSVVCKDGEYFILFEGRKNIPDTTGPDYGVAFTAVWNDGYIGFNSYYINKNLVAKMKKECEDCQKKGWLTKKESNAILAVVAKVQAGDTASFQTEENEMEYAAWGIQRKKGAYYYKNKRVRILMELRAADRSFENFVLDRKGTVDVVVVRRKDNSIKKVKYLPEKKAQKIVKELI